MRIVALPAHRNRAMNPYNSLLYSAVERAGYEVEEFGAGTFLGREPDVVHIHWPEWLFSAANATRARAQAMLFRRMVLHLKRRGSRIVWTVHNLDGHHGWQPDHEVREWAWFVQHIDGWISLSHAGVAAVLDRYPALVKVPHTVIPHGHYCGVYPNCVHKSEVRHALGIPEDARVIAAIGGLQPYKQIPLLARTFAEMAGDDYRLVIAGKANGQVDAEVRAVADDRIVYVPGFVPNADLQVYHRAADLVALPYRNVFNSGSAIMALSFATPVLVPRLGAMAELEETVGSGWVQTYQGELTPHVLRSAMESVPRIGHPQLQALDWRVLGERTIDFYSEVCVQERRPNRYPSAIPAVS